VANFVIDLAPLRKSRDFSLLWAAGLISYFGSMITYVAVPFQVKELTGSYIAVAISGLVEIVPLIIFGLYGGVLADALDRKKLIWVTELLSLLFTAILLINSMMDSPSLLLIYIVSGLFAATSGLRQPAMQAALPRLVDHEDMTAAAALMSLRWQIYWRCFDFNLFSSCWVRRRYCNLPYFAGVNCLHEKYPSQPRGRSPIPVSIN
jgi:MFS family permease